MTSSRCYTRISDENIVVPIPARKSTQPIESIQRLRIFKDNYTWRKELDLDQATAESSANLKKADHELVANFTKAVEEVGSLQAIKEVVSNDKILQEFIEKINSNHDNVAKIKNEFYLEQIKVYGDSLKTIIDNKKRKCDFFNDDNDLAKQAEIERQLLFYLQKFKKISGSVDAIIAGDIIPLGTACKLLSLLPQDNVGSLKNNFASNR